MIIEKQTTVESDKAVFIFHIEGLIKLGESAEYFVAAVEALRAQELTLNFANIDYIDSTGIGELIGSCVALARAGHKLVLVNVYERITKLIEIAHATSDLKVLTGDEAAYFAAIDASRPVIGDEAPPRVEPPPPIIVRGDRQLAGTLCTLDKHMRRITVHGKVQGVGYRFFAVRVARRMGLKGWVQNMPDGTVVAYVEGNRTVIDEWLEDLREGPRYSSVTVIEQELMEFTGRLQDFDVRF